MKQMIGSRNPILLMVAIIQAAIGIALLIGHANHLDADFKVQGLVNAIVTVASALALGGMFYFSKSQPFMASWISLVIYLAVLAIYIATARKGIPNIVHGNWGMWIGVLNLAILAILAQGVAAERNKGAK